MATSHRALEPATTTADVVERILNSTTHFEVFDIPPTAVDVTTITKLYRKLALKVGWHQPTYWSRKRAPQPQQRGRNRAILTLASTTHAPTSSSQQLLTSYFRQVHPDKCRDERGHEAFMRLAEVRVAHGVRRVPISPPTTRSKRRRTTSPPPQQAHDVLGDTSEQRSYLKNFEALAREGNEEKKREAKQRRDAMAARKAAVRAEAAREAQERAFRAAVKSDKKRVKELQRQRAEAAAAREAEERQRQEEDDKAAEAAASEVRKRAKALKQARWRLLNARAALEAAEEEAAAEEAGQVEVEAVTALLQGFCFAKDRR